MSLHSVVCSKLALKGHEKSTRRRFIHRLLRAGHSKTLENWHRHILRTGHPLLGPSLGNFALVIRRVLSAGIALIFVYTSGSCGRMQFLIEIAPLHKSTAWVSWLYHHRGLRNIIVAACVLAHLYYLLVQVRCHNVKSVKRTFSLKESQKYLDG